MKQKQVKEAEMINSGYQIGKVMLDLRVQLEKQAANRQRVMMSDGELENLMEEHRNLGDAITACRVWGR